MKKKIYRNSINKASRSFWKTPVIILGILILFYSFAIVIWKSVERTRWEDESKPFTDDFLKLLVNNRYDKLFTKYASGSHINLENMKTEFGKMHHMFGVIKAYEYERISSSSAGQFGDITSFYLIYNITFDSGKSYQADFDIEIDRNKNRPIAGKIKAFGVTGNLDQNEIFYIKLISEKVK